MITPTYTYVVMVQASDGGTGPTAMAMKEVTVNVTNVDEAGTLTLSTLQPVDGIQLMTTLTDIDSVTSGNPSGVLRLTPGSGPSPPPRRAPTPTSKARRHPPTYQNLPT